MDQAEFYRGLEAAGRALLGATDALARAVAVHTALDPLLTGTELAARHACRRGCDHCCHLPVGVTFGEALRLAAAVAAEPGLAAAVAAAAAATSAQPWAALAGLPCPLLHDGACRVHGARPLPCRALASTDAGSCAAALRGRGHAAVDDAAFLRGLGATAALGDAGAATVAGTRELRQAVAAVLGAGPGGAAEAFRRCRAPAADAAGR